MKKLIPLLFLSLIAFSGVVYADPSLTSLGYLSNDSSDYEGLVNFTNFTAITVGTFVYDTGGAYTINDGRLKYVRDDGCSGCLATIHPTVNHTSGYTSFGLIVNATTSPGGTSVDLRDADDDGQICIMIYIGGTLRHFDGGGGWAEFSPVVSQANSLNKFWVTTFNDSGDKCDYRIYHLNNDTIFSEAKQIGPKNAGKDKPYGHLYGGDGGHNFIVDEYRMWFGADNYSLPYPPVVADTTPPSIDYLNCKSCVDDASPAQQPYETNDTTPTFNLTTDESADCAIADVDLNYTGMIDIDSARNCTDTGGTQHNCTLLPSDALILNETDYLYIACRDSSGNENSTSTSEPQEITIQDVEIQGEDAIQAGIDTSVITGATVYNNQQIYLRDVNNNQVLGTFDKFAISGNQRWAFNYLSGVESFINGLFNLTPTFYAAEYEDMTFQAVNDSVRTLINMTKS